MNKVNKKVVRIFLPAFLALAILVVGILASNAQAQEVNQYPPVVQKIADKFNLNVTEVQQVFDEERDVRRADRYAHFAERLNDFVAEGQLTEEQKEAILERHESMQDEMESLKNLSPEERRERMQALHEENRKWAEENGINTENFGPFKMKFGMREGMHKGYFEGKLN